MEDGFDIGRLIQTAVIFAFFVLPVLKNIAAAKKKQREEQLPGSGSPASGSPEDGDRGAGKPDKDTLGREAWERLLRGEPPPEREPAPPPPPPPPPRRRVDARPQGKAQLPAGGARSILSESAPIEGLEARRPQPQQPAAKSPRPRRGDVRRDRISERKDVTGGLGADASFEAHQLESSPRPTAGLGAGLGRGPGSDQLSVPSPVGGGLHPAASRRRAGAALRGLDARAWRRAVITAEVLAPPLGLRDRPVSPGGPTGS